MMAADLSEILLIINMINEPLHILRICFLFQRLKISSAHIKLAIEQLDLTNMYKKIVDEKVDDIKFHRYIIMLYRYLIIPP